MKAITKELYVENTPEIPGLILRGFHGEEDYPGMLAAYKAAMDADGVEASDSLEELRSNYNHLERCDVYKDMIMAEINGEIVAYGRTWWDAEPDDTHTYTFFINMKPEWRDTSLGTCMAKWLIGRIREIAGEHLADASKFLQGWGNDRQPWQTNLFEKMGMEVIRYGYEMTRPCSEPIEVLPLPEGIEVHPITPELMRGVFDAENEAFRDHWGYIEPTETSYQGWLNWPLTKPDLWKVAFDGDEIVGMVRNFISPDENEEYNRKRGYTEFISVRRQWRRKGVARALLTQSIQMFIEMGMEETCLGVDTENPNGALALYSAVGYEKIHTGYTYRKPLN